MYNNPASRQIHHPVVRYACAGVERRLRGSIETYSAIRNLYYQQQILWLRVVIGIGGIRLCSYRSIRLRLIIEWAGL